MSTAATANSTLNATIHRPDTLWYTRCGVPTPTGIAVQRGWIAEAIHGEGLTLASLQDAPEREVRESHFDHKLLNSFRQGGNIPAIWAKSAGRDTRLLGLTWTDEYQGIITLPETGIRTVADLKGRRIGLPHRPHDVVDLSKATALRGFLNALGSAGIDAKQVEFVDLPDARDSFAERAPQAAGLGPATGRLARRRAAGGGYWQQVTALIRGEVDAIFVKGSNGAELANFLRAHLIVDIGRHPDPLVVANNHSPRTFTVDGHLLRTRPALVAKLLSRVLDAGDWADDHPEETRAYIGREVGSIEPWVEFAYGKELHQHLATDLSERNVAAFTAWVGFLHEHGFIPHAVDVGAWIDRAPLAEAQRLRESRSARAAVA